MSYVGFHSWQDVLAYVAAGRPVYYQAPMMARPAFIRAKLTKNRRNVRLYPDPAEADAFTADAGHLDRFRRPGIAMASRARSRHGNASRTARVTKLGGRYTLKSDVTSHRGRRVYEAGVIGPRRRVIAVGYGATRAEAEADARRQAGIIA